MGELTEQEIRAAIGTAVQINRVGDTRTDKTRLDARFRDVTDTPGRLWAADTEDEAKARLLARLAAMSAGKSAVEFLVWPQVKTREGLAQSRRGKAAAYARVRFI